MTNEVSEFLKKYDACEDGFNWAVENCKTMEEVWNTAKPEWFIWLATRENVLLEKDLHRFACWSVRQIWHLLPDERSRNAIEVKERWIEGKATDEELEAARASAWSATRVSAGDVERAAVRASAREATRAATRVSARDATGAAAWAATWVAAWDAAWAAVRASAGAAARDAAWVAAGNAAWEKQAQYIRDTFTPNFK